MKITNWLMGISGIVSFGLMIYTGIDYFHYMFTNDTLTQTQVFKEKWDTLIWMMVFSSFFIYIIDNWNGDKNDK